MLHASVRVLCVIVGVLAGSPGASAQSPRPVDAAGIYKQRCAMCHGAEGDALIPSQNFADGEWKQGSGVKTIIEVIRMGVPGTLMPAFKGQLTDQELEALAHHLRAFDHRLKPRRLKKTPERGK